ncbi:MarR family winged helix-turn-helix transcriptional regulator [Actinomadura sp. 1N219]|uniref:MarR family winged helix-turn-helix transcriptional regulator n=1 Tax=Actinomadura sp. 1N219 TaxID=3375152 RepID=UPI00379FBFCD
MDRPTHLIEYETMLLGRYSLAVAAGAGADHGHLERSAYILLSRVRAEGPMSIRELSDAFGLDQSTLNRQTSAMTRAGLLERIPDPGGGIARKFRITAAGERRLAEHRDGVIRGLDKVLAGWTPDDVAAFAAYLKRFNTDIERLSGRAWPRPE